jgi:hypothetical protein
MSITRLSGGLTPADGSDPRTFPTIFNNAADEIDAKVVKNNRSGQFFSVIVERNGNVLDGQFWAFGNGSSTNQAPATFEAVLVGMSVWTGATSTGTLTIQINKNGTNQGTGSQLVITGAGSQTTTFATPVSLLAGDSWAPVCVSNTGTSERSTVEVVGYWV